MSHLPGRRLRGPARLGVTTRGSQTLLSKRLRDAKALPAPDSSEKHVPPLARRHRHHHFVVLFCSTAHFSCYTLSLQRPTLAPHPSLIRSAKLFHSAFRSSVCSVHVRTSPRGSFLFCFFNYCCAAACLSACACTATAKVVLGQPF